MPPDRRPWPNPDCSVQQQSDQNFCLHCGTQLAEEVPVTSSDYSTSLTHQDLDDLREHVPLECFFLKSCDNYRDKLQYLLLRRCVTWTDFRLVRKWSFVLRSWKCFLKYQWIAECEYL